MSEKAHRREFFNRTLACAAGAGVVCSMEEKTLLAAIEEGADSTTEAEPATPSVKMPCGRIGNLRFSRLILGGNLISGWVHARDLIYTSALVKAYNTEQKVFETLHLAEQHGIDTILVTPRDLDVINKYKRQFGSRIQTIVQVKPETDDVSIAIGKGADTLYTVGSITERLVHDGRIDPIGKAIDLIKQNGVPAGIGGHALEVPIAAEKHQLDPDYYVQTLHQDRYWSATPEEHREAFCWLKGFQGDHDKYHDNMFCLDPDRTVAVMEKIEKPWIAFKVLAAGAIRPRQGFSYAFRNGADFIAVGMFDFQVAQNAKLAADLVRKLKTRQRPWRA